MEVGTMNTIITTILMEKRMIIQAMRTLISKGLSLKVSISKAMMMTILIANMEGTLMMTMRRIIITTQNIRKFWKQLLETRLYYMNTLLINLSELTSKT